MEQLEIEFLTGNDGNVWYRTETECKRLTPGDTELVDNLHEKIKRLFPQSYKRIAELYSSSERNRVYYKYKIVSRFIRCNMGTDDNNKLDLDNEYINIERVTCPLRGICSDENVICCPNAKSVMTEEETKVAVMYSSGFSLQEIATTLRKSFSTVNNQLWNIGKRLGLKSRREIINLCHNLNLL